MPFKEYILQTWFTYTYLFRITIYITNILKNKIKLHFKE